MPSEPLAHNWHVRAEHEPSKSERPSLENER